MDAKTAYVSSIPADATEKVKARQADRMPKRTEYFMKGERVGERSFHSDGTLEYENCYRNGVRHGWQYRWSAPGELLSAEPYENGKAHGKAYQWGDDGRLIGSYTMEHGTGIDLWWQDWMDGSVDLAEVHYYRDGFRNGFEWWFYKGRALSEERHWQDGERHGIERDWNFKGGLRRGYPRYWVRGERVLRPNYLKAQAADPTLPAFNAEDNKPYRTFPPEIEKHLPAE